ncbi:hypothetical protein ACLB2K_031473 [Fragaria x ananassa]
MKRTVWLPGGLLDAVEHALGGERAEDETGHAEGLVDGAASAGEDAPVPDSGEGAFMVELDLIATKVKGRPMGCAKCAVAQGLQFWRV